MVTGIVAGGAFAVLGSLDLELWKSAPYNITDKAFHLVVLRHCPFPLPISQQRKLTLSRELWIRYLSQEAAELKFKTG